MTASGGLARLTVMLFSVCASFTAVQASPTSSAAVWNTALVWRASEALGPGRQERESGAPASGKPGFGEVEKLQLETLTSPP